MTKPFWTVNRVKPALVKAGGIIADASRILSKAYNRPCAPQTISKLVNSNPELRQTRDAARELLLDACYAVLYAKSIAGDARAQEFVLDHLDPRFGGKPRSRRIWLASGGNRQ